MIFVCFALTLMSFIVEYILGKLDCRGHFRFIIFLKRRDMYKDIITKYFNFKALLNMSIFSQLKKNWMDDLPGATLPSIQRTVYLLHTKTLLKVLSLSK